MLYNQDWDNRSHVSSILLRAADLIEKHGHLKYRLGNPDVGMCANGAIYWAVKRHLPDFVDASNALGESLGLSDRYFIPGWNNTRERTGQQVIDALRAAAYQTAKVEG